MDESKENWFWVAFGKFALVLTVIGAAIGIYTWLSAPSTKLQATVERGAFYLPPQYSDFEKLVRTTVEGKGVEDAIAAAIKLQDREVTERGLNPLALSIVLTEKLKLNDSISLPHYAGYWRVEIENSGELAVNEVVLKLPETGVSVIRREDAHGETRAIGPIIKLGSIGAGQHVYVTAWTLTPPITWASVPKPTLHHAGGPGSIKADKNGVFSAPFFWPMFAFALTLLVTSGGLARSIARFKQVKKENPPAK